MRCTFATRSSATSPAGVYIDEEAALAIREKLVPLASVLTPNLFELGWLSGRAIGVPRRPWTPPGRCGRPAVIVTSAPAGAPDRLANVLVEETQHRRLRLPARDGACAWDRRLLGGDFPGAPLERAVQPRGAASGCGGDGPRSGGKPGTRRACASRYAGGVGEAAPAACSARARCRTEQGKRQSCAQTAKRGRASGSQRSCGGGRPLFAAKASGSPQRGRGVDNPEQDKDRRRPAERDKRGKEHRH